jgi:hypothetical protein
MSEDIQKLPTKSDAVLGYWRALSTIIRDTAVFVLCIVVITKPKNIHDFLAAVGINNVKAGGFEITVSEAAVIIRDKLDASAGNVGDALAGIEKIKKELPKEADKRSIQMVEEYLRKSIADINESNQANNKIIPAMAQQRDPLSPVAYPWGVVYGAETSLKSASYEIGRAAKIWKLTNAKLFHRGGYYRSVARASSREEANNLLARAKNRETTAYIVDLSTWCSDPSRNSDGTIECRGQ